MMIWLMSITMLTFLFMEHPMSMGLMLLVQTMLISMMTSIMGINTWFSYILFLIMIGGMLILFTYMTSIASNEMFKHSNKLIISITSLSFSLIYLLKKNSFNYYFMFNNIDSALFENQNNFSIILSKYLSFPMMFIWLMMIIYLLITMIAVVKITMIKYGPLRQMN
uniref:NADH-ubiquinone oxidoreductase chain 6 n=1 Tax=Pyrocoelia analis TaxID=1453205 RepID=A0A8K1VDY9_9COLE|nr:NADH dehydrogenase subunit 6 [Pyrocoelia analis]UEN67851.1 NADH dehydrogenase subunit 6 [Pyrocoelia analis]UZG66117.1 NADH dehydrogenase subunit 6 [Pyrocoelia analis]